MAWLRRAAGALAPGGLLVVKENLAAVQRHVIDRDDASVARSDEYLRCAGAPTGPGPERVAEGWL